MKCKVQSAMHTLCEMRPFLLLWVTQAFSGLGSAVTSYALVVWSYTQEGSALVTAGLMISSYAPYVLCSIFAGALSDRWDKRRTMLVCDALAALTTLCTYVLLKTELLEIWHLYVLNALNGLMNTVQQPASEVATTALLPRRHYQRVGGLRYLSSSLNSILNPVIATAMLTLLGMDAVILFDLFTFSVAFVALPAMLLPNPDAGENALGVINSLTGVTTLAGSLLASLLPKPKSRVRVVCLTLLLSMSTENFMLAFGKSLPVWCIGVFLGWIAIPLMSTNLDAIMRLSIPQEMQGRVYAARNSLQFFTIPLGYLLGGAAVDCVFEPLMAAQAPDGLLSQCFGMGKGSGAACFFAVLGVTGVLICIVFRRNRHLRAMQVEEMRATK